MILTNGTKLQANYVGVVSGSLSFSGSTSYLNLNPGIIIGSGSYTIDGYFNLPNFNNSYGLLGVAVGDGGSASAIWKSNGHGQWYYNYIDTTTICYKHRKTIYYPQLIRV